MAQSVHHARQTELELHFGLRRNARDKMAGKDHLKAQALEQVHLLEGIHALGNQLIKAIADLFR